MLEIVEVNKLKHSNHIINEILETSFFLRIVPM